MKQVSLTALLAALLVLAALPCSRPAAAAPDLGSIAYVRMPAGGGSQIRQIQPDGSGDHLILALPSAGSGWVPVVAWKPDATELAFSSDHEATTSLYTADIYSVRPDGSNLRRLTNGPDVSRLGRYAKGSVTVDVQVYNGGGPYIVYVEGAASPQSVTATGGATQRLTFANVADLGPGKPQFVVAINGQYRWINAGVAADVQPNATTYAGKLVISGEGLVYAADKPAWRNDGSKVGFTFGRGNTLEQVPASPPDGSLGSDLINNSAIPGFPSTFDWGRAPAVASQILYDSYSFDGETIYRATEGSSTAGTPLVTFDDLALDIKWLPDGSGFLASVKADFGSDSNIVEYDFATQKLTQLTHFTNEFAGHLSISPDGQTIVFERAAALDTPTDLWLISRDGTNMRELVKNASRPSWSPRAPQVPTMRRVYVPLATR
jgi:Tol biopolymer transport system component